MPGACSAKSKAIVTIARNEGEWPAKTCAGLRQIMPEAEIIGVDDGGENDFAGADCIIQGNLAGVGRARRMGVIKAADSGAELVMLADAHVFYKSGSVDKAWRLAESHIVNPTYESYQSGEIKGCGRIHKTEPGKHSRCDAHEGREVSLYGSVYFLSTQTALDIVAPTPSHGCNEQIMSCAAWALGCEIYACPDLIFRHLYKQKFNYRISAAGQKRNRKLLRWWFFEGAPPENADEQEIEYHRRIQKKRILSPDQLNSKIETVNRALANGD